MRSEPCTRGEGGDSTSWGPPSTSPHSNCAAPEFFAHHANERAKPLTCDELRRLRDRFGSDPLSRLLLWEIARLRSVVRVLYRQICRLSYHRPAEVGPGIDEETEAVLDVESVILENAQPNSENCKYGRKHRWPHMSAEAETALGEKKDADANGKLTEREFKRRSREAR